MQLTEKQKGVVRNVIPAAVLTVAGLGGGTLLLLPVVLAALALVLLLQLLNWING
jgi:hypothetical protein